MPNSLADLRRHLAEAALRTVPAAVGQVSFGAPALDGALGGGIARAALHEVYAPGTADLVAATGFAVGLAIRAAGQRPILWVRQDVVDAETGRLHPPGLTELGLDPGRVLLVRARDAEGVLRAGSEAARCAALGAVLIEPWGEPRRLDLTASRRLSLAAEGSGTTTLLLRAAVSPQPSAARTRWQVAALPSRALEANAPGDPAFSLRLLRHRGGLGEREWRVEWSRDRQSFQASPSFQDSQSFQANDVRDRQLAMGPPDRADQRKANPDAAPLSGDVVSFPADRPAAAGRAGPGIRRAG
jgi:protein ImuA